MRIDVLAAVLPADRPRLLDLWVAAWSDAMPTIDFSARRVWFAERIEQHFAEGARLITACAEAEAALLGFAFVDPAKHYLDQIAVDPRHKGQGVASALIAAVKAICPDGVELHVNQDNTRAVRLYEREGFRITGAGTNPRSGLPIWHMRWRPEPSPQPEAVRGPAA